MSRDISTATPPLRSIRAHGSVHAETFARTGIGILSLIDRDAVELSNLQRQLLLAEKDIDRPKAQAAAERLQEISSGIRIVTIRTHLAIYGFPTLSKTIKGKWFQDIFLFSPLRMAFRRSGYCHSDLSKTVRPEKSASGNMAL